MAGLTLTQVDQIVEAVADDQPIKAIKLFREFTGVSLVLAKEAVRGKDTVRGKNRVRPYTPEELRAHLNSEWVLSTGDRKEILVREMRELIERMDKLVAEFAELCDDSSSSVSVSTKTAQITKGARVRIVAGTWAGIEGTVVEVDTEDLEQGGLPYYVKCDHDGLWRWLKADELELIR